MGRWIQILAVLAVLVNSGCISDKSANGNTPFESSRYPAMQSYLDSAFAQFCSAFDDAMAARIKTDTAEIPALTWPFEMPARRRDGTSNFVDDSTSWGVGYNHSIDTTLYAAFWILGRLVDTGVLVHDSPIIASHIIHRLEYGRSDGFGDDQVSWSGTVKVDIRDLDTDSAHLEASITAGHRITGRCANQACDAISVSLAQGEIVKVGNELSFTTLSGTIAGTITLREFDVILGHFAVFDWELSGTVANGLASITLSSGDFSQTDTYSLCP